jgi:hypothetical protein
MYNVVVHFFQLRKFSLARAVRILLGLWCGEWRGEEAGVETTLSLRGHFFCLGEV